MKCITEDRFQWLVLRALALLLKSLIGIGVQPDEMKTHVELIESEIGK